MNLNIVLDSNQFRPFDYSMALNAIKEYNSGYEKQQAIYDKIALTLGDLASAVEGTDKAKKIYDAYQDLFNTAATSFANGMNFRNAKLLVDLRRLYGTQIMQLEKANEAMVKEAERRRAVGPEKNMLYLNIGNLDDWIQNPARVLGSYSGTLLSSEVAAMASAVGSSMINMANSNRLDPYHKTWLKTKGFKPENINKAVAEVLQGGINNVKDDILRGILLQAMSASGINNWADESTKRAAENMAARGLYGGIGQSEMGQYEDKDAIKALDYYWSMKEALKNGLNNLGETVALHFSDRSIASNIMKRKLAEATAEVIRRADKRTKIDANGKKVPANYYAHKIIEEWKDKGGLDAAVEYWTENGFNGDPTITGKGSVSKDGFYWGLRDYIRKNITKDERIIDLWTSPYETSVIPNKTTKWSSPSAMMPVPDYSSKTRQIKNWKNFDERAAKGYTYNGILAADDPTLLKEYLTKLLPTLQIEDKIKLYDIKDIDSNGNFTYSDVPTSIEDFPTKKDNEGNISLDTSRITNRISLPDGSWILTWNDKNGHPVQKVLRALDRSIEYQGDISLLYGLALELMKKYEGNPKKLEEVLQLLLLGLQKMLYGVQRQANVQAQNQ